MKKIADEIVIIFFLSAFVFILEGCKDSNPVNNNPPCGGIGPLIVPEPPYNSPIWHPSGKFIGFNHTPLVSITYPYGEGCWGAQHFRRDSTGFWLINPDGTNMHRIFPYTLQTPAWSPDGQWIAFSLPIGGDEVHIFKMRFNGNGFDTTSLVQLTSKGRNFFPDWSPDGQWIAYDRSLADSSGPGGIWVMRNNGTMKRSLFGGAFPDWHPNGNILIGAIGISPMTAGTRFVRYDFSLSNVIDTLLAVGNDNRFPRYSPDETRIAFWSSSNLWIMDSTGGNLKQLTIQGVDVDFGLPFSWSPAGSSIVYTDYRSDDWGYDNGILWILNTNTGEKKQLTFNLKPVN